MSRSTGSNVVVSGGIGFPGALCLLFVGLKLGGVITWSWCWVLSPLWLGAMFYLGVFFVLILVACILGVLDR